MPGVRSDTILIQRLEAFEVQPKPGYNDITSVAMSLSRGPHRSALIILAFAFRTSRALRGHFEGAHLIG